MTLALALLATGGAALISETTVVDLRLADLFAVALLAVGVGLLVGAWWGRARWLIAIGFALLPLVLLALLVPLPRWQAARSLDAGGGEELHRPIAAEDLADEYVMVAGRLVLDLRDLEIPNGETATVSVDVTAGQVEVLLPSDADAVLRARALVGNVRLPGWNASGLMLREERTDAVGGDSTIELDLAVRAGEIEVTRPPPAGTTSEALAPAVGWRAPAEPPATWAGASTAAAQLALAPTGEEHH